MLEELKHKQISIMSANFGLKNIVKSLDVSQRVWLRGKDVDREDANCCHVS